MSLEDADEEESQIANELKYKGKSKIPVEKRLVLKNAGLLFSTTEKIPKNFRSKIFPTKNSDKIPAAELTPELTLEVTPETAVFDTPKLSEEQID